MSKEEQLFRLLLKCGFINVSLKCLIPHPTIPGGELEVDNLAQFGQVVLVFEGKKNDPGKARSQLLDRFASLRFYKNELIQKKMLDKYTSIRLFYYSIKRRQLIEFDASGNKLQDVKFNNERELCELLQKFKSF